MGLFNPKAFHLDLFVFEKKETDYCSYNEWWNPSIYPSRVVQLPKPYTYCKKNKKRDNKHKYFLSFIHTELLLLQDRVILHHNESNYKKLYNNVGVSFINKKPRYLAGLLLQSFGWFSYTIFLFEKFTILHY